MAVWYRIVKKEAIEFVVTCYLAGEMFHSPDAIWGTQGATIAEQPTDSSNTDVSTVDTLAVMSALARRDSHAPIILQYADSISSDCRDSRQAASGIWYWVREYMTFKRHEEIVLDVLGPYYAGIESQLLIPPADVVRMPSPQGDCAIYSMLVASLLIACGIPARYRVVAVDPEETWRWSHVYVIASLGESGDYSMDASHGRYPGWETKRKYREMDWNVA